MLPFAVLVMVAAAPAKDGGVPRALECLGRHYRMTPLQLPDGGWAGRLADGGVLVFDDGLPKSDEQRLAEPDLQDMLASRYPRGPVRRAAPGEEAGRIRVDRLFTATYGEEKRAVQVVRIEFFGHRLWVQRGLPERYARIEKALGPLVKGDPAVRRLFERVGGTFEWRLVADAGARRSAHSYGISLDLNPSATDYWAWKRDREKGLLAGPLLTVPDAVVQAFEAEGFAWGGRWYHFDTMHFEYRPELFDEACR